MLKTLFLAASAALLIGCASKPVDTGPKPVVRTISVVSATLPQYYSLQNLSAVQFLIPIASLGYSMNSRDKAKLLTDKLPAPSFRPDEDLTTAVADALRSKGYEVTILKDVKRTPDRPDSINLETLPHETDALVHVYFSDVGVESPRTTTNYLPRVNVNSLVYVRQNQSYPFDSVVYYGVDAREGKDWAMAADPKHAYPDFDFMVNNLDVVRSQFSQSAKQIGQRLAERIHAALN